MMAGSKSGLLLLTTKTFDSLISVAGKISPADSREAIETAQLSVCDHLAILVAKSELFLEWYKCGREGKIPVMPSRHFSWSRPAVMESVFILQSRHASINVLQHRLKKVSRRLVVMIEECTSEELFLCEQFNWTGAKWSLSKWLVEYILSPAQRTTSVITKWNKSLRLKMQVQKNV